MVQLGQFGVCRHRAAQEDLHGLHHLAIFAGLGAHEADFAHVGLAAGVGAAGPVHAHRVSQLQPLIQLIEHRLGGGFGGDQGETAVAVAGAAHRFCLQGAGVGTEALQQRFRQQGLQPLIRHIHYQHILGFIEA